MSIQWSQVCNVVNELLEETNLVTSGNKFLLEKVIDTIDALNYPKTIVGDLEKKRNKIKLELNRLTVLNTDYRTLLKFIAQKRLEKVAESFKDNKYSVKKAAYLSGFNNPSNFTKKFKSNYACSPKDYLVTKLECK